jgi:hypothetical protein
MPRWLLLQHHNQMGRRLRQQPHFTPPFRRQRRRQLEESFHMNFHRLLAEISLRRLIHLWLQQTGTTTITQPYRRLQQPRRRFLLIGIPTFHKLIRHKRFKCASSFIFA